MVGLVQARPLTKMAGFGRAFCLRTPRVLLLLPRRHLIAQLEELLSIPGAAHGHLLLWGIDLSLATAGTGDVAVNDFIIGKRIDDAPFNEASSILALAKFLS
jgi:hypothetical protein